MGEMDRKKAMTQAEADLEQRLQGKRWRVIFNLSYDAPPEEYFFWDKDKEIAFQMFNYFKETKDDPDYPKMYSSIELQVCVDHLSRTVEKIQF